MRKLFFTLPLFAFLVGCSICPPPERDYYKEGIALSKLSAAVESTVRYKNPPKELSNEDLLELSTQHDPSLRKPFEHYLVKILSENRHAILLVCLDEETAILEDAGCTKELDKHHWKESAPCQFSLDSNICN